MAARGAEVSIWMISRRVDPARENLKTRREFAARKNARAWAPKPSAFRPSFSVTSAIV